jgi:uncharacterized protein (DUF427 family)
MLCAAMPGYPSALTETGHIEPVPRRIRAFLGGEAVFDTTSALYVWEWPNYPQYYVPVADVRPGVLIGEGHVKATRRGEVELHAVQVGEVSRPSAAQVLHESEVPGLSDTVRFEWGAFDAWFEEDERVFVHPRSPYSRVDALRSNRPVRIELEGAVLAEAITSVIVFETGLPPRFYLDRTSVNFEHLVPSPTVTACPYKGETTGYWSVDVGGKLHEDLAWSYDFPTRQLLPIAGLISFYNEKVDIVLDGEPLARPVTHFSK